MTEKANKYILYGAMAFFVTLMVIVLSKASVPLWLAIPGVLLFVTGFAIHKMSVLMKLIARSGIAYVSYTLILPILNIAPLAVDFSTITPEMFMNAGVMLFVSILVGLILTDELGLAKGE